MTTKKIKINDIPWEEMNYSTIWHSINACKLDKESRAYFWGVEHMRAELGAGINPDTLRVKYSKIIDCDSMNTLIEKNNGRIN